MESTHKHTQKLMKQKGYEVQACLVESIEFGVPVKRKRLYLVALHVLSRIMCVNNFDNHWQTFKSILDIARCKPPGLEDCLNSADDEAVVISLRHRQEQPRAKLEASTAKSHMKIFQDAHLRWGHAQCRKLTMASPWFSTLSEREVDVLVFWQHKKAELYKTSTGLLCADIGQSIERVRSLAASEDNINYLPTILPGSKLWLSATDSFAKKQRDAGQPFVERLLIGEEALRLQGFHTHKYPHLRAKQENSQSFMLDMAGNMFSGSVILSVLAAHVIATKWNIATDEAEVTDSADVESALQALKSLKRS